MIGDGGGDGSTSPNWTESFVDGGWNGGGRRRSLDLISSGGSLPRDENKPLRVNHHHMPWLCDGA